MKNERLKTIVEKVIGEFLANHGPRFKEIVEQTANAVAPLVASHVRVGMEAYLDAEDKTAELNFLSDLEAKAANLLAECDDPLCGRERHSADMRAFLVSIVNRKGGAL